MSKETHLLCLSKTYEKQGTRYNINTHVLDKDDLHYACDPICDIYLEVTTLTAASVGEELIKLGEALKEAASK